MSSCRTCGMASEPRRESSRNTSPDRATARWALIPVLCSVWALAVPSARAAESGYTTGNASGAGATWNDAAFPYDTTFTDANLTASGGGRAVNIGGTDVSEAGEVYNFVFGIPSGATIAGIQVRVEGSSSTAGTTTFQIGLSGNNGASWFEKSASFTGTTDTPSVYGSTTDLWGTTWTSTQVDSTHFRVRIYRTGISTADLRIDRLQVNVTYSVSPTLTTSGFMRVKSGTYNGNGVDGRAVTGLGFQPDLVIVVSGATCANLGSPNNCGHDTVLRSSTMGAGLSKATNQYGQYPNLLSKRITSLDADGFTVGHPADHNPTNDDGAAQPYHCANHNGVTYYWVAFKAAPGEMALGTYVGSGSDTRDPLSPGLLFQPDYVLVMPGNGERVFHRTKDMTSPADSSYDLLGNKFCSSGCTGGLAAISSMQANGFTVGPRANVSGVTYHYVVWKAAAGRTAVGTFTGNGSDSRQFTAANGNGIGLQPEYLSVTRGTTTTTSPGSTTNVRVGATGASSDLSLLYYYSSDSALTPTDRIQKLLADGFELGTSTDVNSSTSPNTYYYVAFAGANPSGSPTTNYRSIGAGGSYSSSTVAVTNASTTVNGNFTQWLTNRRGTGDVFTIDYVNYYTVARVLSETQLELTQTYQGTTNSNVGYSISRQFSTLQAWEDCISKATTCTYFPVASANLVADNRVEIGVAFPGGDFSTLVIDGSITGPTNTITLTTDLRYRHKGILNGGVRLNNSGNNGDAIEIKDDHVTVEWIEVGWGNIDGISVGSPTSTDNKIVLRSNLFHDMSLPTPTAAAVIVESPHTSLDLYNNFMYQFYGNGLKLDPGASWAATSVIRILNNTMYFVSSATCPGVNCRVAYRSMQSANANVLLRNNIASNRGPGDSGSGFDVPARNAASSNNLAGLGDASGVNHSTAGTGLEAEPSFEGTSVHLTAGSPGIDQGADLSAIIPRLDIDAQTRPAGTAWDIGADEYNGFTAVRLASFRARGFDSAVFVEWETASELDNLGFHLYRGLSENGPWERLTQTLIPGLGSSPEGKRYSFLDAGLRNGATYFYRLEDLDRAGRVTSHGPVSATPLAGAGAPPSEPARPEPTPTPGPPEPGPEGAPPSELDRARRPG